MVKIPVLSSNEKQRQKLKLKHGLPGFQFQPVKSPIISITRHYLRRDCGVSLYGVWLVPLPVVPGLDTGEDNVGSGDESTMVTTMGTS